MNIKDKFRKRWLGVAGYAGGDLNIEIEDTLKNRAENAQSQSAGGQRRAPYKLGERVKKKRRLGR